jgi:hypothetical protein
VQLAKDSIRENQQAKAMPDVANPQQRSLQLCVRGKTAGLKKKEGGKARPSFTVNVNAMSLA